MASQTRSSATVIRPYTASPFNDETVGSHWTLYGSHLEDSDNTYAQQALSASDISRGIGTIVLGFSLPTDATVDGIEVSVERKASATGDIRDKHLVLTKDASTFASSDKADSGTSWPTSDASVAYGGPADKWGLSWTASEINHNGFGYAISAYNNHGVDPGTAYVDQVQVTVYYTEAATTATVADSSPIREDSASAIRNETIVAAEESPPRTDAISASKGVDAQVADTSPARVDAAQALFEVFIGIAESSPARADTALATRKESASVAESSPARTDSVAAWRKEDASVAETSPARIDSIAGGVNTYVAVAESSPARSESLAAGVVRQATIAETSPARVDASSSAGELWHQALRRYRPLSETRRCRTWMRHTGI